MKGINNFVVLLFALLLLNSCDSLNKMYGKKQTAVCEKEMMQLQEIYYVGIGQGQSIDAQHAKEMAREKAREFIAEQMNVMVQKEIITTSKSSADPTTYQKERTARAEQLIAQRLSGLTFFCSETRKNDAGLFTAFVGLKLDIPKAAFKTKIKKDLGLY